MDKMSFWDPLGGSFCPFQSYFTCRGAQNIDKFLTFARFGSSWRGSRTSRTFIFKNGRPASTEARFSKPVRARTGSELQRECILSLGIKRELGRESEKTRREAKERITTRYLIPSYTRAWRHESKTASRLESPRA